MASCISFAKVIAELVREELIRRGCRHAFLSGGIDTSFVTLAGVGVVSEVLTVIYDTDAPDLRYSQIASSALRISRHVIYIPTKSEIESCLDEVLTLFRTIDPVEVACDIPLFLGLKLAKLRGYGAIATGDGGDELFLGYDFLLRLSTSRIKKWMDKVLASARFSSLDIGKYLDINVVTALYIPKLKSLVPHIPYECLIGYVCGVKVGKYLLRQYLALHGLPHNAFRRKDPVMFGSGFHKLLRYWSAKVSTEEALALGSRYGVKLPSRAHAYLLKKLTELGIEPPSECSNDSRRCPVCGACLERGFCRFCGTYVDSGGTTTHYSDELASMW